MYLLKTINYEDCYNSVKITNGIRVEIFSDVPTILKYPEKCYLPKSEFHKEIVPLNEYWGDTEIFVEPGYNYRKDFLSNQDETLLYKISKIESSNNEDGFKKFVIWISKYIELFPKVEGYVIFVKAKPLDGEAFNTNGKILFSRFIDKEIVCIIKEGEYLEFAGKRFEMKNGKFIMMMD